MNYEKWLEENLPSVLSEKAMKELCLINKSKPEHSDEDWLAELFALKAKSRIVILLLNLATKFSEKRLKPVTPDYFGNEEMMKIFGVSARTLATWRKNGTVKFKMHRNKCLYPVEEILNSLEKNYRNPGIRK